MLAPRIVTCMPPPGAPLFAVMTAPGIFPWSAFSTFGCGTRLISAFEMTVTALAAFLLDTLVPCPVTTTSSSSSGS